MKRNIELLAPGGDKDSIKTAILAGADAVYCGLPIFNARNRAENIEFEDLQGLLRLAHEHNCQIFLTLNIVFLSSEFSSVLKLLNKLVNTNIDGVIVQDIGLFYILSRYFPTLKIHASTQTTTHNEGQLKFLKRLNAERVNLSRELNISEIKFLTNIAHKNDLSVEVFVHGSYCLSFSGICYMSSVHGGRSGNRGRCSQPCREKYTKTPLGKNFPLNLKDNSAYSNIKELYDAGVDSLKIEGRIKEFDYVHTVVSTFRRQLDSFASTKTLINDNSELYKVFNRDFTNAFLVDNLDSKIFIDNPMSNSGIRLSEIHGLKSEEEWIEEQNKLYSEKEKLRNKIKARIDALDIAKIPLDIYLSGSYGTPLVVSVKTPQSSYKFQSKSKLEKQGTNAAGYNSIRNKLNAINDTEYYINKMELNVKGEIYLPFSEITTIKKEILLALNNSKKIIPPVSIPALKSIKKEETQPTLSVIISNQNDIDICNDSSINVYFQLPNNFDNNVLEYVNLFKKHNHLIPWFPSILIGSDYTNAIEFIKLLKPQLIITNNSGIAYEAYEQNISWIAGPYLNITNSYSLLALKEKFNCIGSFISNEVNKSQVRSIKKPNNFKLFFSIYHPIPLMTSRACLFSTITGCKKTKMDDLCLSKCVKQALITNMNNNNFYIEKSKGCYNKIYSPSNLLNLDIINDMSYKFDSFFVDLRDIKTETQIEINKNNLISLFKDFTNGCEEAGNQIKQNVYPTSNAQYNARIL